MRQTSITANKASEYSGLKQTHWNKILRYLERKKRATSYHISKGTGIDYTAVARRMSELERENKVVDNGKLGFSPSGLPATVWEINIL